MNATLIVDAWWRFLTAKNSAVVLESLLLSLRGLIEEGKGGMFATLGVFLFSFVFCQMGAFHE